MRDMAHSICLMKLSNNDEKKIDFLFLTTFRHAFCQFYQTVTIETMTVTKISISVLAMYLQVL